MATALSLLQRYWGYDAFRPKQEEIILHVAGGGDALGILPTGGGKSICYQVPALMRDGVCVVVSPLIALMHDQAQGLERRGIRCAVAHSALTREELDEELHRATQGEVKFVFVSPERLRSALFLAYLAEWNVGLLAVDEAHCVSQWGYDFRPPYLQIAEIRPLLPGVPVIALTASATPAVQADILEKLGMRDPGIFFTSFARPNLSFSAFQPENKLLRCAEILEKVPGSAIVYCRSRRRTVEVAHSLQARGIGASYYHAGLDPALRQRRQEDWLQGHVPVMVCTNAFGMGIDKPDVRLVVHYDVPDTPEGYYQEAGRAGRDGKKAYAVLLYYAQDLRDLKEGVPLRYPPDAVIRKVYQAVCAYLHIALGEGEGEVFDFEPTDFCTQTGLNLIEATSAIRLLAMQELWTLSDSVFTPGRVRVSATREALDELERHHPDLDEMIKALLRTYGGILLHPVPIREFELARHLQVARDYVDLQLMELHRHGLIEYTPAGERPTLFFRHRRLHERELTLDLRTFALLRERYEERIRFMTGFAEQTTGCRANALVGYFGEKAEQPCGQCDLCLARTKKNRDSEFARLKSIILREIPLNGALRIADLCRPYSASGQEDLMNVIRFLLDEGEVLLDARGDLILPP